MSDEDTRSRIRQILEGGLATQVEPRADSDEALRPILKAVREADSLEGKLDHAGFTLHAVQHEGMDEACESCMYFAVRRRHCDLPELALPVEPDWSCRLWRI